METWPLRLAPGIDLRIALYDAVAPRNCRAALVVSGAASLRWASLRMAGATDPEILYGELDILRLAGTVAGNGGHLHLSVADPLDRVLGGHAGVDGPVRTAAEVLLVLLPEGSATRAPDRATGFAERVIGRLREIAAPPIPRFHATSATRRPPACMPRACQNDEGVWLPCANICVNSCALIERADPNPAIWRAL
ncbi:MAG: DNA-binding protein [Rhodoferax sp.]|nr:DNA-binding protein [Rhodoferax sp.]